MSTPDIPVELADERRTIDNIDAALIHILAERFRCTQRVGHIKAQRGLPAADLGREAQQVQRLRRLAEDAGEPDLNSARLFPIAPEKGPARVDASGPVCFRASQAARRALPGQTAAVTSRALMRRT